MLLETAVLKDMATNWILRVLGCIGCEHAASKLHNMEQVHCVNILFFMEQMLTDDC